MNRNRLRMNTPKRALGPDEDTRSLLKAQHKKVYSVCRLFADNYKEHQGLFTAIIAGASQSIRGNKPKEEKNVLFLRACINMAALHSLSRGIPGLTQPSPDGDSTIQFKSPDYQKSMVNFREGLGDISDYQKFLLFLHFENVDPDEILHLSDLPKAVADARIQAQAGIPKGRTKKRFIPYLMDLIWS